MMTNPIGKIFYFGNPLGGFKTYPIPEPIPNLFEGYNDNTPEGWKLLAKKEGNITSYTYVLYGVLTSTEGGRISSCLGISIEFVGCYFTNLPILLNEIFLIIKGLIKDETFVAQTSAGNIGFTVENFTDVREYLDTKSQKIRKLLTDDFPKYIRLSEDIPNFEKNNVRSFHPDSSAKLINEIFENYGIVILSPNGALEQKSAAERAEDEKKTLEMEKAELRNQIAKLENDKKILESEKLELTTKISQKEAELQQFVYKLQEFNNSISSTFPVYLGEKANKGDTTFPFNNQSHNYQGNPVYGKRGGTHRSGENSDGQLAKFFKNPFVIMVIVVILLILFVWTLQYISPMLVGKSSSTETNNSLTSTSADKTIGTSSKTQTIRPELSPAPNAFLKPSELNKLNSNLKAGMTASEIANFAINNNNNDLQITYYNKREAYTYKLIEENADCFDGKTKESKLICENGLKKVPIYKIPTQNGSR